MNSLYSLLALTAIVLCLFVQCSFQYECSDFTKCSDCSTNSTSCYWCSDSKTCSDISEIDNEECKSGFCNGDTCYCDMDIWPYPGNIFSQCILIILYGAVLAFGAKWIADGSELLLEILDPGIIGGLVLPIIGAVPDAAMIVVSGALGSKDEAQNQIAVGMGTLAGSTVMLLTIPWAASLWVGRCDFKNGEAVDKTLTRKFDFLNTGISVDKYTLLNARIALVTTISYLIIQIPAFFFVKNETSDKAVEVLGWIGFVGFCYCFIELAIYCIYQVINPKLQEKKMKKAREEAILKRAVVVFQKTREIMVERIKLQSENANINTPLLSNEDSFVSLEESDTKERVKNKWASVAKLGLTKSRLEKQKEKEEEFKKMKLEEEDDDDDDDHDEDREITSIDKIKIAFNSVVLMLLGGATVSIFSDPMVDVIDMFADEINIPVFYVSFVITPFCSNASELISSLIFASKKRKKNASMTYSGLYGAAIMNSTMCLGIFYIIVFARGLAWTFNAETLCIVFTMWVVCSFGAVIKNFKTYWVFIILAIYPMALGFTALLEFLGLT